MTLPLMELLTSQSFSFPVCETVELNLVIMVGSQSAFYYSPLSVFR